MDPYQRHIFFLNLFFVLFNINQLRKKTIRNIINCFNINTKQKINA